jgi:Domain of unknown function (DUF4178)
MAGNPGDPELPNNNEPDGVEPPKPAAKPTARTFSCPNCGGSVTIKYPGASMSAACENCHSVVDVTDTNYQILSKYVSKTGLYFPDIPLGSRGKLRGKLFEVIGFMARSDVASRYYWFEYLLFNPYYGYRFLTEDKGNFTLVTMIKRKPEIQTVNFGLKASEAAVLDNRTYRIYNRGRTRVDYVIGEFYWRVVVGSEVSSADYIDPPEMLSIEFVSSEVVWSQSTYIEWKEIQEAFKVEKKLPWTRTIGAIEPSQSTANWKKIWPMWVLFLAFITCAQIFFVGTAKDQTASEYSGAFMPNSKVNDITVPKFTLEKGSANVIVSLDVPVSNSWFYVSGEMVNNANGTSYPFEMTSEYYFGTDSDGYWDEGSMHHELEISSVPAGEYYLNLDTESGDFKDTNQKYFTLRVKRDVPSYANYWWFALFLSMVPCLAWAMMRRDEPSRWSNSDFNPYAVADS